MLLAVAQFTMAIIIARGIKFIVENKDFPILEKWQDMILHKCPLLVKFLNVETQKLNKYGNGISMVVILLTFGLEVYFIFGPQEFFFLGVTSPSFIQMLAPSLESFQAIWTKMNNL